MNLAFGYGGVPAWLLFGFSVAVVIYLVVNVAGDVRNRRRSKRKVVKSAGEFAGLVSEEDAVD